MSRCATFERRGKFSAPSPLQHGFTLVELVVTMAILAILSLSVVPLYRNEVKRQREQRLRETLREIRAAIDEFHRDTIQMQCGGAVAGAGLPGAPPAQGPGAGAGGPATPPGAQNVFIDPRSKVVINDCTIFTVENPDHYPPTLETLTAGVSVVPRAGTTPIGGGINGPDPLQNSTDPTQAVIRKKVYLRNIPVDPMTGKQDWLLRSCYDEPDSTSWGGENVFDVRSKSEDTALNGEKYNEW